MVPNQTEYSMLDQVDVVSLFNSISTFVCYIIPKLSDQQ